MRKLVVFSLAAVIIASLFAFSTLHSSIAAAAQATPAADCDPGGLLTKMASLKSTGDKTKDMQTLDDIAAQISDLRVVCNGMTVSGVGSKVLDPISIPTGDYRVKLQLSDKGYSSVYINGIGGKFCDSVLNSTDYLENTVTAMEDCRAVIKATTATKTTKWTVTFEPLK